MAIRTLEDLLAPMPQSEFLEKWWGKKFCHISGERNRFHRLLSWDSFNSMLESQQLKYPRIRIAKDGESPSAASDRFVRRVRTRRGDERTQIDALALTKELRGGATLIVDAVDDMLESVRAVAVNLEKVFQEPIQANAYAGWGTSKGFDLHWDDHDVLVVQIDGSKHWQVYGVNRESPLYRDVHSENEVAPTEPIWEGVLQSGDILYLPRGWWHVAVPRGESTLHLSFGINCRTGIDLLSWLNDKLRDRIELRKNVPRNASNCELLRYLGQIQDIVAHALTPAIVRDFFSDIAAHAVPRTRLGLPWTVLPSSLPGDEQKLRTNLPRPFPGQIEASPNGEVTIRGAGNVWTFKAVCEGILRIALDGEAHSLDDLMRLPSALSLSDKRDLIKTLILEGLLYVEHGVE